MSLRAGRAVASILFALALSGCPQRFARPEGAPTEPGPVLARLAVRAAAVRSLSGMLALEVWQGDERVRLRQLVLFVRPDRIRVDTLSPFDQPLAMMASDGQTLSVYSLEHKRFEQGPSTPTNLARLLRLPLGGEELTALLAGGVPVPAGARTTLDWDSEAGAHVLEIASGTRRQRLWVEPAAYRMVGLRTWEGERELLSARFGDYDGEGPTAIPRRLRFEVPGQDLRVDARFEDHTLNVEPPSDAFTIAPPRGIPVQPL